ncbi:helix-turn-helix domain-containing protein [Bacillus cereus]|uniref:helix-turn-helix domain-containing protein n=1 Tax=Bacillus cereus TaxID=1396 RepID=UPI0011457688|nr:helix-turn-helix domain-containing protein [Bacillus cereus]
MDKIVKDGGLLEQIGYIKTATDYPVTTIHDGETGFVEGFLMASDIREMVHRKELVPYRGVRVKMPTTLLERSKVILDNEAGRNFDGTLYKVENTFNIQYEIFESIIKNPKLGCNRFLVYSILKSLCKNKKQLDISQNELSSLYKINKDTIQRYLLSLEKENYIEVHRSNDWGKNNRYSIKQ